MLFKSGFVLANILVFVSATSRCFYCEDCPKKFDEDSVRSVSCAQLLNRFNKIITVYNNFIKSSKSEVDRDLMLKYEIKCINMLHEDISGKEIRTRSCVPHFDGVHDTCNTLRNEAYANGEVIKECIICEGDNCNSAKNLKFQMSTLLIVLIMCVRYLF